ncbi:hypothetical protein HYPSUDRAFT_54129 [Hypholoma sublateritium FD-334 SS-4]|uniref:Uncharacterized protein n=1 Tax=Hypholoma sublateritium (strain FD-334 SS-4) TaxID=945553 RepID=A0A0D2PVW7_HYPSF|nr:hypothetical protein HYPSUDRAFT_54129 [Hypholoma sublateritium FD-334 SS-4]
MPVCPLISSLLGRSGAPRPFSTHSPGGRAELHRRSAGKPARGRFPGVAWELADEECGRRVVYPPRAVVAPHPLFSRSNESTTDCAAESFTLALENNDHPEAAPAILCLAPYINHALFSSELEYLCAGRGFGEAFAFLFSVEHSYSTNASGESEYAEALLIDKLRKDPAFMQRSWLHSGGRFALAGNFGGGSNNEATTAILSSHRFILHGAAAGARYKRISSAE